MEKLLNQEDLTDNSIDAWGMLMRYQLKVEGRGSKSELIPNETFILRSHLWEPVARYHVNDYYKKMCKLFVDNKIEQAIKYKTWLFPINTTGKDCSLTTSGDHWTLLRFTLQSCTRTFYNSMSSRKNQIDHHLNKAMELINYVEGKIVEPLPVPGLEIPLALANHRPKVQQCLDSPQQGAGTLDCGGVVCDLVERMIKREAIPKQAWSVTTGGTYPAKMVDHIYDMCKNNAMKLLMIGV